jgi:hypothetical protein
MAGGCEHIDLQKVFVVQDIGVLGDFLQKEKKVFAEKKLKKSSKKS